MQRGAQGHKGNGRAPVHVLVRAAQAVMNWPQPPCPVPLHSAGEDVENLGVKLSLWRKEELGERCFKI